MDTKSEKYREPRSGETNPVSRRTAVRASIAAAGGLAFAAQSGTAFAQSKAAAPARKFRAWVTLGNGPNPTTLHDVTLRPISGRQIVVRNEATQLCYTMGSQVLGLRQNLGGPAPAGAPVAEGPAAAANVAPPRASQATIHGHGGVGIVEAVGPEVKRVQVGDRVLVNVTPQCGSCYQCLRGRADMCQFLNRISTTDLVPIADMADGTPVFAFSHIGGLAELMVTFEEWVVPVFTTVSSVELAMLPCVGAAGLGTTTSQVLATVEPGSNVVVMGAGPLGLSAIQGARISGASEIIAVEPIKVRRELALKVGATHALDPNAEGNRLIETIQEMCKGPTDRLWAGGRDWGKFIHGRGPDFVVEAVGAARTTPRFEAGPDPTGILPMTQAYMMCSQGGHVVTTGIANGTVSLPAVAFSILGRTHHAGQYGGTNPMRNIPRYVTMIERGQYDAKSLVTTLAPFEKTLEAYRDVMERATVTAVITFA